MYWGLESQCLCHSSPPLTPFDFVHMGRVLPDGTSCIHLTVVYLYVSRTINCFRSSVRIKKKLHHRGVKIYKRCLTFFYKFDTSGIFYLDVQHVPETQDTRFVSGRTKTDRSDNSNPILGGRTIVSPRGH